MKTKSTGFVAAASALMLLGTGVAQAAGVFCVSITAQKQGELVGQSRIRGCEKKIDGLTFAYSVISPRDAATGLAVGRRQHKAIKIKKEWSSVSPQLFQALASNETLTSVVFDFFAVDAVGQLVLDHSIKLTNAVLSSIEHTSDSLVPAGQLNLPPMEILEFVFQSIELVDYKARISATDSWVPPQT